MRYVAISAATLALCAAVLVGGCAGISGIRNYSRHQKLLDAKNRTRITKQQIQTAKQQADVVHAQDARVTALAEQRVIEAEGIRRAQDKISATLTPLYVQHEAIQAQRYGQGERTYIPVGPQGVPLVADVNGDRVGGGR